MVTSTIPFKKSDTKDEYYKYIAKNMPQKFWSKHSQLSGKDFLSSECKDLIQNLIDEDPLKRYSISEIKQHPWYTQEVPTDEEIKIEFDERYKTKKRETRKRNKEEIEEVIKDPTIFENISSRAVNQEEIESDDNELIEREILEYDPDFQSTTQFFSSAKLDDLWYTAATFIKGKTDDVIFSKEDYSLSAKFLNPNEGTFSSF